MSRSLAHDAEAGLARLNQRRKAQQPVEYNMKQFKLFGAAAAACLLAGSPAFAASATFQVSAAIQQAISLTNQRNLNFANIVSDPTTPGTVVVNANGTRNCAAVLTCIGTATSAQFVVNGSDGTTFNLTLPASANITSGANSMLVQDFQSSLTGGNGTLSGGTNTFTLGATLNVGAAQAPGAYSGTFNVSVNYQ